MQRALTYLKVTDKGTTIKLYIEAIGNDVQAKQRLKTLNGDRHVFDIKMVKMELTEANNLALYANKARNFTRFTPEASIYLENNYKAKKGLKTRKINNRDLWEYDLTWINDYCKKLGDDDEQ